MVDFEDYLEYLYVTGQLDNQEQEENEEEEDNQKQLKK